MSTEEQAMTTALHPGARAAWRHARGHARRMRQGVALIARIGRIGLMLAVALALLGTLGPLARVQAAGPTVVTTCDKPSLDAALAATPAGGTVAFGCSGTITDPLTLGQDVTLDGSGQQVTLSGGGMSTVISVTAGAAVTLNDLTIADGYATGALIEDSAGVVTATTAAGGIYNAGALTLLNSTVINNTASYNAAFYYGGPLGTGPINNINDEYSGGILNEGTLHAIHSTLLDNTALCYTTQTYRPNRGKGGAVCLPSSSATPQLGGGGGLVNAGGATAALTDTVALSNTLDGIRNYGQLTMTGGGVTGSIARDIAGFTGILADGLFNGGALSVSGAQFLDNELGLYNGPDGSGTVSGSTMQGGGYGVYQQNVEIQFDHPVFAPQTALTVTTSLIDGNGTDLNGGGGGISLFGGAMTVISTTISNNPAQVSLTQDGETCDCTGGILEQPNGNGITASLTLISSTVTGNTALGGGGGIADYGDQLAITQSVVSNNTALNNDGGGLMAGGATVLVSGSTIAHNAALFGGSGGGISNDGNVTVVDSTISGNTELHGHGAGINNDGYMSVTNSTISANNDQNPTLGSGVNTNGGGGICNGCGSSPGTLLLNASTVSGNVTDGLASLSSGYGAGILNLSGPVTATASIIAGNGDGYGDVDNCARAATSGTPGGVTSGGYNLDDDGTCFTAGVNHDQANVNPLLGPLQDNGGPTFTQALGTGSPAIGVVPAGVFAGLGLSTDQRGLPRPGLGKTAGDVGAYETQNATPATVTLGNLSQQYTGTAESASASVSPTSCGPVSLSYSQNGTPVSAPSNAGSYSVQASLGNSGCIITSGGSGMLVIATAPLTITANNQNMVYGGALPAFTAGYSGFVGGDSAASLTTAPTCTTTATSSSPAGQYASTCSGAVDPNYSISYVPGTLTINQGPLTITASSPTVVYNGSVPAITPSYSGFVNGDSAVSLSSAPTCGSTAPASGAAGTYTTSCTGAADPNYSISYVPGTLIINQAAQTITFGPLANQTLGTAPFAVSASGGASGNPVTFTAGPNSVCTSSGINGATITVVGVGTCTVIANQAGNANYQAAASVAQSFTVSYPPLTLALGMTNSPPGPVTTGSVVTTSVSLTNHTAQTQAITLATTLTYTGSRGTYSHTTTGRFTLNAGQTGGKTSSVKVQWWFLRGTYTLRVTAKDASGDTAKATATLTIT